MSKIIFSLILVAAAALPSVAPAQQSSQSSATSGAVDQTYLDFQVEQTVRIKTITSPEYPSQLRAARIEGQVLVQFVVDEKGRAQMNTFKVLRSSDNAFSESVKIAISETAFFPAEIGGRKVKQLVQQPFKFAASK